MARAHAWVLVLGAGALGAAGLALGRADVDAAPPPPPLPVVDVVEAALREVQLTVEAHGTVEPRTEIDLVIETTGRIRSVAPDLAPGGYFAEGELLVELDPTDARLEVDRAEAVLARAESEARLAEARSARLAELARQDVASPAQLEESQRARDTARARAREARANLELARLALARTRVVAPFAGRVREKQVDVGQFVTEGTAAARVFATDGAEVRLPIPSSELRYLDLAVLEPHAKGPPVRLRGEFAGREVEWKGHVVRSEAAIAPQSRTLHLVVRVDEPDASAGGPTLPPPIGMFVHAEIRGRRFERECELPASALRGGSEVLVLDAASRLQPRRVEILRAERDRVLIQSGLSPGERVAVSALAEPGIRVRASLVAADAAAVASSRR